MRNHVHLIVQVDEVSLSRIMQNVSQRYTKWVNYTQSRTGHIFQGRYKALLVDADSYLLELVRYVHLNPVRAGAVALPEDYLWSSHRHYAGMENVPWLTSDFVLGHFSTAVQKAKATYGTFLHEGMEEGMRAEFQCGICDGRIVGDETFADDVLLRANQKVERQYPLDEVIAAVCCHFGISADNLKAVGKARPMSEARAVVAAIVQQSPHLRLVSLANVLNRDFSALGKAAQRAMENDRLEAVATEIVLKLQTSIHECPNV